MHLISREKTALWVNDIVAKIGKIEFMKLVVVSDGDPNESPNPNIRKSFRVILDYFLIFLCSFIYFFMFKKLMP